MNVVRWLLLAVLLIAAGAAQAAEADLYCNTGASGPAAWQPASATNPCYMAGTIVVTTKPVTWIAGTSGTLTASATVVAAGPTISIITNTTAAGGGTLSLSLAGGTAVNGAGIPLAPQQPVSVYGQPTGTAITGVCSTGTCSFAVQSGS